jgi:hypothetical protein
MLFFKITDMPLPCKYNSRLPFRYDRRLPATLLSFALTCPQTLFYYSPYGNVEKAKMPGLLILPVLLGNTLPGLSRTRGRAAQAQHGRTDRRSRID